MVKKTLIAVIVVIAAIVSVTFLVYLKPNPSKEPVYILITIDVERDLEPFLDSYEGVTDGVPIILEVLRGQNIKATLFVTGDVASRYPDALGRIAEEGHEIGGHGFMHEDFLLLNYDEKYKVINKTTVLLKRFDVKTFRSPYQSVDAEVIDILKELGYCAEASHEAGIDGFIEKPMLRITSEPLFYPSSTYPASWIDVYNQAYKLALRKDQKVIVVGLHSWEVLEMPRTEGAEEYVRASGNYTYTNLVNLIKYLNEQIANGQNLKFLTAKELCRLFLE